MNEWTNERMNEWMNIYIYIYIICIYSTCRVVYAGSLISFGAHWIPRQGSGQWTGGVGCHWNSTPLARLQGPGARRKRLGAGAQRVGIGGRISKMGGCWLKTSHPWVLDVMGVYSVIEQWMKMEDLPRKLWSLFLGGGEKVISQRIYGI